MSNVAYMQGYNDYLAGQYQNPYDMETDFDLFAAWDQGFNDASEDD